MYSKKTARTASTGGAGNPQQPPQPQQHAHSSHVEAHQDEVGDRNVNHSFLHQKRCPTLAKPRSMRCTANAVAMPYMPLQHPICNSLPLKTQELPLTGFCKPYLPCNHHGSHARHQRGRTRAYSLTRPKRRNDQQVKPTQTDSSKEAGQCTQRKKLIKLQSTAWNPASPLARFVHFLSYCSSLLAASGAGTGACRSTRPQQPGCHATCVPPSRCVLLVTHDTYVQPSSSLQSICPPA